MSGAHQLEHAACVGTLTFQEFTNGVRTGRLSLENQVGDEKFDGRRYFYQVKPNGEKHNFLTSRRISKVTGRFVEKQDSMPLFKRYMFGPDNTVYDGEFIHPDGGTSHEAATAIAQGFAVFRVFDLLMYNGHDIREWAQWSRWAKLKELSRYFPKTMHLVPHSLQPVRLLEAVRACNGEGIILKNLDAIYGKGWIKVVAVENHDVVVVGYEMSKSDKYGPNKWIKGVKIAQWFPAKLFGNNAVTFHGMRSDGKGGKEILKEIGQVSGFNEQLRAEISENKDKFMNRVMVIKAKGRETSFAFRHPRFDSWHADKNPAECRYKPEVAYV